MGANGKTGCGCGGKTIVVPENAWSDVPLPDASTMPRNGGAKPMTRANAGNANGKLKFAGGKCVYLPQARVPMPGV